MSGSTIGGVVGGAIGFYFGGPQGAQVGWMIGSAVGGYVDPEQISQFGPRLQDAAQQTANDGIPIPYGYGTFPTHGNIIWCGPVVEHVNESTDDGKGSGVETTTTTYSYSRSYAIGICQGEIAGLLQIKRNGKIVWDARTDEEIAVHYDMTPGEGLFRVMTSNLRATSAKFSTISTIYTGSETQTADPTIEAHEGVGNVPGFRGLAYMVVTDDDVTELRGAIPQYEFVVRVCGEFEGRYVEPGAWVADDTLETVHKVGDGSYTAYAMGNGPCRSIAMSPDARSVWVIVSDGGFDPHTLKKLSTVDGSVLLSADLPSDDPRTLCVSPDGAFIYINYTDDFSIAKLDASDGSEISRTGSLGGTTHGICITPDGSTLYAALTGVQVIDTASMTVTTTIGAVEGGTGEIAMRPDGSKVYAVITASSNFMVIDTSDNSYAKKAGPNSMVGVCFSPDSTRAYLVGSGGTNPLRVFDAETDTQVGTLPGIGSLVATNMNHTLLFVGDVAAQEVDVIDISSGLVVDTHTGVDPFAVASMAARPLP